MDVDVGHLELVGNDTNEVKGDVASLGDNDWVVSGALVIELEDTGLIIALGVGHVSQSVDGGWLAVKRGGEVLHKLVSWHVQEVLHGEEVDVVSAS